jgi:hypothetical protein
VIARVLNVTALLVVGLGLVLRARGFLIPAAGNSMWLDEAMWAIKLIDEPLADLLTRPIGFMAATKLLVNVFGAHDAVFRLLAWLGGVATALMAIPIARRLFRSEASRLLFVSILALDPSAIDLSKEFKPYALGLAIHAGMLLLALRYRDSGSKRDLIAACALIAPSVLFAQDTLFAYPGLFAFMGLQALRARRTRHAVGIAAVALVTLGVVASMHFFVWNRLEQKSERRFWGEKYDVFFVRKNNPEGKADWFGRHYAELMASPGQRREVWNDRLPAKVKLDLSHVDAMTWFILHVAGLVVIVRERRLADGLLLYLPLLVMGVFNLAGFWPFGVLRTNLFSLVYIAAIAAVAIDRRAEQARLLDLAPATVLVLLPLFLFEEVWHSHKETSMTAPSQFEEASQRLLAMQGATRPEHREVLALDAYACYPAFYYAAYHEHGKRFIGPELDQRFSMSKCLGSPKKIYKELRRALRRRERAWLLMGSRDMVRRVEKDWPGDLELSEVVRLDGEMLASVRKRRPEPPTID